MNSQKHFDHGGFPHWGRSRPALTDMTDLLSLKRRVISSNQLGRSSEEKW